MFPSLPQVLQPAERVLQALIPSDRMPFLVRQLVALVARGSGGREEAERGGGEGDTDRTDGGWRRGR